MAAHDTLTPQVKGGFEGSCDSFKEKILYHSEPVGRDHLLAWRCKRVNEFGRKCNTIYIFRTKEKKSHNWRDIKGSDFSSYTHTKTFFSPFCRSFGFTFFVMSTFEISASNTMGANGLVFFFCGALKFSWALCLFRNNILVTMVNHYEQFSLEILFTPKENCRQHFLWII